MTTPLGMQYDLAAAYEAVEAAKEVLAAPLFHRGHHQRLRTCCYALRDLVNTMGYDEHDEDTDAKYLDMFDALAYLTSSLAGPHPDRAYLTAAVESLERALSRGGDA